ncbi:hypothetical protein Nepgr_015166 [Nepenthes gracilis]|uniref:Alpha-taxilin n=1 Tax=Nepenthes gracilis TaxID=150966 RepID=A0AAD3SKK6_NEPGR|nr:hypothetical protein Nepgr_015166 [Nepenthes gracilis]
MRSLDRIKVSRVIRSLERTKLRQIQPYGFALLTRQRPFLVEWGGNIRETSCEAQFEGRWIIQLQTSFLNNGIVIDELVSIDGKAEKTNKHRTFPVPLSEKDGYDASGESAEVSDDNCMEQREETLLTSLSSVPACATLVGSESGESPADEKEKDQLECRRSEKSCQGGLYMVLDHSKEASSSEYQKNRKEAPEGKCKNSKRILKTDKEVLEFNRKYQQVLVERDAAISVRDKLESLCRELQRQNKLLMEQCRRISEEGQNLRLDLSTKFNDAIQNVSNKLEEQKDECLSQMNENEMLREKLKQLADQHDLSDQQYTLQLQQKTLELKIAELKIQRLEEKLAQEQAQIKLYAEQVSHLLVTEKNLREQLTAEGEKFQQFQDAWVKSNEVFETYKQEIEKMVQSRQDVNKEIAFLKSKCVKSDFTLVELLEERERMKKQLERTKNQKDKLESLCRLLQAERKQNLNGNRKTESPPQL